MQEQSYYMTDKEVANHFGVSRSTIHRWVRQGVIAKSEKIGLRTTRWKRSVIEDWKFR